MKLIFWGGGYRPSAFVLSSGLLIGGLSSVFAQPIHFKNRRELFVDDYVTQKVENAEIRLQTPQSAGTAIRFTEPWEGRFCAYVGIVADGVRYRMYYRGAGANADGKHAEYTCYAESADGIHWAKPTLRICSVNGSKANNVVMLEEQQLRNTHNFTVMYDGREGVPSDERFKAVGGSSYESQPERGGFRSYSAYLTYDMDPKLRANTGLFRYVSADGLHWKRYAKDTTALFHEYALDSQNSLIWLENEQCYAVYFRGWSGGVPGELFPANGTRTIMRSTSKDFINWTKPEFMSFGDTEKEHLYTNATRPYFRAPHLLIAMPFRFSPQTKVLSDEQLAQNGTHPSQWKGVSDGVFMTSRGGTSYDRKFMESFVRPGNDSKNWGARSNMPAMGVIQTAKREMSFFITRGYGTPEVSLERMTLRLDGFAALHAGFKEGVLLTKPMVWEGQRLLLNYSTGSKGYIKIVLTDEKGNELSGFGTADALPITGDEVDGLVQWKSGRNIGELKGKSICAKIIVKDADVFSFGVFD